MMFTDLQQRFIVMVSSWLAGIIIKYFGIYGLDQHTADVVAQAVTTGGTGWAIKFYTDWNKKTVPVDAVVVPAKVVLPPTNPKAD